MNYLDGQALKALPRDPKCFRSNEGRFWNPRTRHEPMQVVSGTSYAPVTYEATNSLNDPNLIHPVDAPVHVLGGNWRHHVPALTIEVLDIPLR